MNNLKEIITKLEKIVPDTFPRYKLEDYEAGRISGKLEIIDFLKELEKNTIKKDI